MIKGKTIGRRIFITLEKEKKTKSGLILSADADKENGGLLKDVQKVVLTGNECQVVEQGDKVRVNFDRYYKKVQEGQMKRYKHVLSIPTINIDGLEYGKIVEFDVEYIYPKES